MAAQPQKRREVKNLSTIPWKTFAGNIAGVTAAHAAGYYTAGALANALAKSRFGARFRQLSPARQKRFMQQAVTVAGTAATAAATLASYAGKVRTIEEQARLQEIKRLQGMKNQGTKTASVAEAYLYALQRA